MGSNQPEINSIDQYDWRDERSKIYHRLRLIAKPISCDFISLEKYDFYKNSIVTSKHDRVISSLLFDQIPNVDFWNELDSICQIQGKKIWVVTDNLIDKSVYSFENIDILSYPQLLGIAARTDHLSDPSPSPDRLYNCFMQRSDSVRQSWFYFLWIEGLLDDGYVSYLLYQLEDYSKLVGVDLFDFIHYNKNLDQLQHFTEAYRALRDKVPYRNFAENHNLITYIQNSKYSINLETYATNDDHYQWCFTEKVLRSLQSNTISLIFAQKHSIKILEELGLEIDKINHQWDSDDWVIRQRKILEVLKTDGVLFDAKSQKDRCQHNRKIFHSWKTEYQRADFFDTLLKEIESS